MSIINQTQRHRIWLLLSNNYALWIGLAFVIVISAFTYHSDFVWLTDFAARTAGGNLHLYQDNMFQQANVGSFTMPPFIGLFDGFLYWLFRLVRIVPAHLNYSFDQVIPPLQMLLLKSRYILVFILSYPLIKKTALYYTRGNLRQSQVIANIWITSPILLYLPFAQGNNDIYPAVFSIAFLLFAFKRNFAIAMILLGLTAALKNYAIFLFLPAALILAEKNLWRTLWYGVIAVMAYAVPTLLFSGQLSHFFQSGGEGTLFLSTYLPSNVSFVIAPIIYIFIMAHLYFSDNDTSLRNDKNRMLVIYCFLSLSVLIVLNTFIPQWLLWLLPFLVLLIFENRKLFGLYLLATAVFFVLLFTNWPNNLDLKLFRPLLPISIGVPSIRPTSIPSSNIPSLVISSFSALLLGFIYFLIKDFGHIKQALHRRYVAANLAPLGALLGVALLYLAYNFALVHKEANSVQTITNQVEQHQALYTVSLDSLAGTSLKNISRHGTLLTPTALGPQITLSSLPVIPSLKDKTNLYVAIKFGGPAAHYSYNPTLFIKHSKDKDLLESVSINNFLTTDGRLYYAPINSDSLNKAVGLRLLLQNGTAPFTAPSITVISVN